MRLKLDKKRKARIDYSPVEIDYLRQSARVMRSALNDAFLEIDRLTKLIDKEENKEDIVEEENKE